MFNRNILLLIFAMPLAMTSAPFLVFIGGILGGKLAPTAELATLPLAVMIVGSALATIPAAAIMQKYGRRAGFLLSEIIAIVGALTGLLGVIYANFYIFLLSALLLGLPITFVQQSRFAAIESLSDKKYTPKLLSVLMLTGIIGGFLGPEMAFYAKDLLPQKEFTGSFVTLAILHAIALAILSQFSDPKTTNEESTAPTRSIKEILSSPPIIVAIAASAIGYGLMTFVMTATPNSMHDLHHHSLGDTKWVIQSHIAAMFLPSLFSGWIIVRFGAKATIAMGCFAYLISVAVGLAGVQLNHFFVSLLLLGVGWNFIFVAATTLLSESYQPEDRFKAQAANEFITFGSQAVASLSAGWVLFQVGWNWILYATLPFIGLLLIALAWVAYGRKAKKS